ncbi:fatty acyl-AMP ligase [Mesorhizobium sp. M0036]|uniref:fatty acyl-AMP ligase n=1 Tax=Mesorhizobium sp. M0036 TaxID=2956853 RepID=UPI003335A23E
MKNSNATIADRLLLHSEKAPESLAFRYLTSGDVETESMTYGQLAKRALSLAAYLSETEPPGTHILLLLESGLSFIEALFGCMFAALIPIPVDLPRVRRPTGRLDFIVQHSSAPAFITSGKESVRIGDLTEAIPAMASLRRHIVDADRTTKTGTVKFLPNEEMPAFIQYTSGSTSAPKGVFVAHKNLVCNQQQIQKAFGHGAHTKFAGWLPMFHDMGLVGNVLQPVYLGVECSLMPPAAFIQRPSRWLRMISKYRSTTSGGPNFAFDHCVDRISESDIDSFDLSSWQVAFNGAEPIRERTIREFGQKFRRSGFSATSFLPCYGLAEATLFVSGQTRYNHAAPTTLSVLRSDLEDGVLKETDVIDPKERVILTSSGPPAENQVIAIVDADSGKECHAGHIGEIWLAGPNVAEKYLSSIGEVRQLLSGELSSTASTFLRTGDLGAMWNGELFVVGRIKNLIIVRGRNIHAEDIEQLVSHSHSLFQANRCAAFSIETIDGEERLVVVQEIARRPRDTDEVRSAAAYARQLIIRNTDVAPHDILIVRPGTIPTTSSGKIRHADTRTAYTQGLIADFGSVERATIANSDQIAK